MDLLCFIIGMGILTGASGRFILQISWDTQHAAYYYYNWYVHRSTGPNNRNMFMFFWKIMDVVAASKHHIWSQLRRLESSKTRIESKNICFSDEF